MSGRTWTVVKFVEEDTVEAVPTTWLVGNLCYWPPYPREKLVTAIKNFEAPNTHWPSHKMEIFRNGTFDDEIKRIKKQYVFLTNIMADMKTDLTEIKSTLSTKVLHSAEESFFLKFSFPINDEATLETVESYLIIDENFQNAVPELANIGGHNVYDFVKRAMTFLVTNKFASKYSFLGRKQKGSFSILKLSELLIKAANHSKKADRKEVEEAISKWLRRANERKGQ
ncbi:unnamed protein product [Phaedon cochleariae]|uniref:DUF4806 domain-containing protein n=1 Tax=Phaedon cochleariae TaxID=80249 RepID=A0A9P0DNZ7_PHACE|nr:unnamed protein product [Phaedon cochleariae]